MNTTTDWYTVESLSETTTRITETENVRMYLVVGEDRAVLVDAGRGIGDLRGLVGSLTDLPLRLFLTHWHWDHIGSAAAFDRVRMHEAELASDGRVTIDAVTDEFVDSPRAFVDEWRADGKRLPDSFEPGSFSIDPVPAAAVDPIEPGDEIDLGDRILETYHIPGHSPGQLGLLDRTAGVFYGGDVVHIDRGLYLHFETGDVDACLETFEQLAELRAEEAFDTLLTCHNEPIHGADLELIRSFRDGLREIVDGGRDYDVMETDYGKARRYLIDGSPVLTRTDTYCRT